MNPRIVFLFSMALYLLSSCAPLKNVARPADDLPEIEVRVNTTPEQIDDYVNTSSYIPCTIGLVNYSSPAYFPSGYQVQLRNIAFPLNVTAHGGRLVFSATGTGAGSPTLNVTLPPTGWLTFYIKGITNSTQDKDAIIEVLENRTLGDNIVLARKSLQVTNTPPVLPAARLEIRVNEPSTIDDYLTWSPMICHVRVTNPGPLVPNDLNVTIRNMPGTNKLRFEVYNTLNTLFTATPYNATATLSSINITVPKNGSDVMFYVAGYYDPVAVTSNDRGSAFDKDAVLEIIQFFKAPPDTFFLERPIAISSRLFAREGMMVRIRKNANNLAVEERDRFLNALVTSNTTNTFNRYIDLFKMHRSNPINQNPNNDPERFEMHTNFSPNSSSPNSAFLPWHRAYLQHLELILQAIDPSVTVPYWKFDAVASHVFDKSFMGLTGAGSTADISTSVLSSWTGWNSALTPIPGILRKPWFNENSENVTTNTQSGPQTGNSEGFTLATTTVFSTPLLSQAFENAFHGPAHFRTSGPGGYLGNLDISLSDPLFFLLHANMDRVWAKWQFQNNLFNPANTNSYDKLGLFNSSNTDRVSEYADETMWPWNGKTGAGIPASQFNVRPTTAPGAPFPVPYGYRFYISQTPVNKSFIDYRNIRLVTIPTQGLNFAYDDTPY